MPSNKERVILNCDGASRGNPGRASAGGVLKDSSGNIVAEYSQYLGIATNNVAEYKALIIGLDKIKETGSYADVQVFSDSELMVKQLNGQYRIKEPSLKLLAEEVLKRQKYFNSFSIKHVPRAMNKHADALANRPLDEA